jgi:hypothetical protein
VANENSGRRRTHLDAAIAAGHARFWPSVTRFSTVIPTVSAIIDRPKVPAEYGGLALLFRDEVQRIDREMDRALAAVARVPRRPPASAPVA